ncbi:MAG TPA: glutamate-5-semialdehyde dehydrogenase [Anaerolineales bacterium]|nr:glutamate-5-semialdehyde dehydrogenase [Anaerolineales bacterium]
MSLANATTVMIDLGKRAKIAARQLALLDAATKNRALQLAADELAQAETEILAANRLDLQAGEQAGLSAALLDRLMLNESRLAGIIADLRRVAELPDPVGEIFDEQELPNGLHMHKQRTPLGVLGVIYESRPNVTVDVVGLAIKSGNAAILRGGSETIHSNRALAGVIRRALQKSEVPVDAVLFIDDPDRRRVHELLQMHAYVDIIIPRGGAALHQYCRDNSRIPVITGGIGICHLFVEQTADLPAALEVIHNAKTQRPSVCNALDTVLVQRAAAQNVLPAIVERLAPAGVTFRADSAALSYLETSGELPEVVQAAGAQDFDTEWISLTLGLKVVEDLDQALAHIAEHSTGHSDGILTQNMGLAKKFVAAVDSAVVYVNASTRFTDGSQLGLGAEIAISTQRLHARGPMALRELTTYKWVVAGNYHTRP